MENIMKRPVYYLKRLFYFFTHLHQSNLPVVYAMAVFVKVKVKVIPQQTEVAQGVPGRLMLRIFLTFSSTRVVGRQPHSPAAFTPGEIPGNHF